MRPGKIAPPRRPFKPNIFKFKGEWLFSFVDWRYGNLVDNARARVAEAYCLEMTAKEKA